MCKTNWPCYWGDHVTVTFNLKTKGDNQKYMAFSLPELFSSVNNQNVDICVVTVKKLLKRRLLASPFKLSHIPFIRNREKLGCMKNHLQCFRELPSCK